MTLLLHHTLLVLLLMLLLGICAVSGQNKCAKKGCSYDGTGDSTNNNGQACTCLATCVALERCCNDYLAVCGHLQGTTVEEIAITTESVTSEEEIVTTTESATTEDNIRTTDRAITTTEDGLTSESIVLTADVTELTESVTLETEPLTACGPFPTWLDIVMDSVDGNTVWYICKQGFSFSDDSETKTSTCSSTSEWEPAFVQCEESVDPKAEAEYNAPEEAPGAYYIGSFALILLIGELVFLIIVDLATIRNSFRVCMKRRQGRQKQNNRKTVDIEAQDIIGPSQSSSSKIHVIPMGAAATSIHTTVQEFYDISELDPQPETHKQNVISW